MANPQIEIQRATAALRSGETNLAARICEKLLTQNPRNSDARHLRGRCMAAMGRWQEAVADFRRVLGDRADYFPVLVDLGIAETQGGNHQAAEALLERARVLNPQPAELHFGIGLCRLGSGEYAGAARAFRDALERNPRFPDAFNNLGVAYDRLGQLAQAAESFRQAAAIRPGNANAHRNLGDVLTRLGDFTGAVAAFQRVVHLKPADALAQSELGAAYVAAGGHADAVRSLEQALALDGKLTESAVNLGEALRRLGHLDRAAAAYRRALAVEPACAAALLGLANLAVERGDAVGALQNLAAAAKAKPEDAKTALLVAARMAEIGSAADALPVLREAARRFPSNPDVHDAMGVMQHRLGQLPEALDCYERALALDERRTQTLLHSGLALESTGALNRAIATFEEVLKMKPSDKQSLAAILSCAYRLCDWELIHRMMTALRELPNGIDELPPFLLIASDLGAPEIASSLQRRARAANWPASPPPPIRPAGSRGPLRVAYVSPDFRAHPVGFAIAGMIEQHDRARITPLAISLKASDGSAIALRLERAFEHFIDVSALSDRDVVKLMREQRIDIAIDLAGLTSGSRPSIFALRPAAVQINFLGYPGSTGLPFMDYIVADETVVPRPDEPYYTERVLRLPHTYLPFDDSRSIEAGGGRLAAGLPADAFVFCAFTNGFKITKAMFEIWMDLLREIPGSVLWLRSMGAQTAANLRNAAAKLGVESGRLVFAGFVEQMEAHLSRLQWADLFLDTVPYNAHTTAAEALWAGVPVVTCIGESFAGRVGASLLTACGLPELICANLGEYRSLALDIARSHALRDRFRDQLRRSKPSAPAFNTRRYAKEFENLLFDVYRQGGPSEGAASGKPAA